VNVHVAIRTKQIVRDILLPNKIQVKVIVEKSAHVLKNLVHLYQLLTYSFYFFSISEGSILSSYFSFLLLIVSF